MTAFDSSSRSPGVDILAVRNSKSWPAVRALYEFMAVTVTRFPEASPARWDELDLAAGLWTIPSSRTVMGQARHVPLVPRALAILDDAHRFGSGRLVFPSAYGKHIARSTLQALGAGLGLAAIRTLRDQYQHWCATSGVDAVMIAHALGRPVRGRDGSIIRDTEHLDRRRLVMQRWVEHIDEQIHSVVVSNGSVPDPRSEHPSNSLPTKGRRME